MASLGTPTIIQVWQFVRVSLRPSVRLPQSPPREVAGEPLGEDPKAPLDVDPGAQRGRLRLGRAPGVTRCLCVLQVPF